MIKCELCDAILYSKYSDQAQGWDWFTGYLDRTMHYCPTHSRSSERNDMFERSQQGKLAHPVPDKQ